MEERLYRLLRDLLG